MRRRAFVATRWLSVATSLALAGCHAALLEPRGPVGRDEKSILIDSLAIMLAIVVPTIVATLLCAWWFRASNRKARYLPTWAFSGGIELVVWSIPILTILLLGGVTWIGSYQLDPAKPLASKAAPLEVQVVSLDWKWLFIYPEQHVASINRLVIPAGVPVHFKLTSASVMNTFFVPQLGSMIYTMNGMAGDLNLQADQPGSYYGRSAHFSGDGFPDMQFEVRALPAGQFTAWVGETRRAGGTLDSAAYRSLTRQSIADRPTTFAAVEDGLFRKVVEQDLPPGPGPTLEHGGAMAK